MVAPAANEECLIPDLGTRPQPVGTMDQDKQSATKHSNLIHFKTMHLSFLISILFFDFFAPSIQASCEFLHIMLTVMRHWQ